MNEKEYNQLSERYYNGEKLSKEEQDTFMSETLKRSTAGIKAGYYHKDNYYENRMAGNSIRKEKKSEITGTQEISSDDQENHTDITLEDELAQLKEEQAEAERIYRQRMEMNALIDDPESIKELAKTILDRKAQIEDLEARIGQEKGEAQEITEAQNQDISESEEKSLEVYRGNNPIVRWLYRLLQKMENGLARFEERNRQLRDRDPMEWYRGKVEEEKSHLRDKQYDEYRRMAEMDLPKEKTSHELFVEKVSGNGAYHTSEQDIEKAQEEAIKKAELLHDISSEEDLSK